MISHSSFNDRVIRPDQKQRADQGSHEPALLVGVGEDGNTTAAFEDYEESSDPVDSLTTDDIRQAGISNNSYYADMLMVVSGIRGLEKFFGYGKGVKFVMNFIDFLNADPSPYFRETVFSMLLDRQAPSPEKMAKLRGCKRQNTSGDIVAALDKLENDPRFASFAKAIKEVRASSFEKTFRKQTERARAYKRIKDAKFRVDIYTYHGTKLVVNDIHYVDSYEKINDKSKGEVYASYEDLQTKKKVKVNIMSCKVYKLPDNLQVDGNFSIKEPEKKLKITAPTIRIK